MASRKMILTLAKVIIAAAWADGEISQEEQNSLKDLLFQLPNVGHDQALQLSGREWEMLELYMATPIDAAERERLVVQLQGALRRQTDKQLARLALENMIHADGKVTAEEPAVFHQVKAAIESVDLNIFSQFSWLVGETVRRRSTVAAKAPNREDKFDDFIKNRVYYALSQRLNIAETDIDIPEKDLRRLSLAGGLLAKIAHVDEVVEKAEYESIVEALVREWNVERKTAVFIAEVAVMSVSKTMDPYRMMRQFAQVTSRIERVRFLDVLFAVAAADGFATFDEIEEIRTLSRGLNLTNPEFIAAKIRIPREKRAF